MLYKDNHTSLLTAFTASIYEQCLLQNGEAVLLAMSGGIDSVVMGDLFYQTKLNFAIAHCNFGLRGGNSDQDEAFVQQLAQQYHVACYHRNFDTLAYAKGNGLSIQMAARKLRYEWFEQLCLEHAFHKVATAHHGNDNLETILLNLTKGTGISGLHGILPRQGKIIRPLLFATKAMIQQYAQEKKLYWREDASNQQNNYARNFIRNKVFPLLKILNPNLEETSKLTIERLCQTEAAFQEHVAFIREKICYEQENSCHIALEEHIKREPWIAVVIWEILKPFGFSFLQIKHLLANNLSPGKMIYSTDYQLHILKTGWMIHPRNIQILPPFYIKAVTDKYIKTKGHALQAMVIPREQYTICKNADVAALDLASLTFPLTIRKWEHGDYFFPLGMQQRKKLSDFLIDLKVPRPFKEQVQVVVTNKGIAWVVGYRIDDRFKVQENTKLVYELRINR